MKEKIAGNIENISIVFICWIGILFGGGIVLSSFWGMEGNTKIFTYVILAVGIISWLFVRKTKLSMQLTSRQMLVILSVLCLIY